MSDAQMTEIGLVPIPPDHAATLVLDEVCRLVRSTGEMSAAVRVTEAPSGERDVTWLSGPDVEVLVFFHDGDRGLVSDVISPNELHRLDLAGLVIDTVRDPRPTGDQFGLYAAASCIRTADPLTGEPVEYVMVLVDRAAFRVVPESQHRIPDGRRLGEALLEDLVGQAHHKERARMRRAERSIGPDAMRTTLSSTFFEELSAHLEHREIPGASGPMVEWWLTRLQMREGELVQEVVQSSLNAPEPGGGEKRGLTAALFGAVGIEAWGVTEDRLEGSNTKHASFDEDRPSPKRPRSPRPAEDGEIKPRPDNHHKWDDLVGNLAAALADGDASFENEMTLGLVDPIMRLLEWRERAGLSDDEISAHLMREYGYTLEEIGEQIQRHKSTAKSRADRAQTKIEKLRNKSRPGPP